MLARRGRLNIKPNLAKGGQKSEIKQEKILMKHEEASEKKSILKEDSTECVIASNIAIPHIDEIDISLQTKPVLSSNTCSSMQVLDPVNKPSENISEKVVDTPEYIEEQKNIKRKFNGDEMLDTKTMRIMDMIYWNPKKGPALLKKRDGSECGMSTASSPEKSTQSFSVKPAAPQVKIGPDGNIILDESSLVVEGAQNDTTCWETVDDDRFGRKTTSLSFRSRLWRKGSQWSEKETELFYEILRCTGPDFGLMHEYFPARARCELKSKYNREERTNWDKLKKAMSVPMLLDDSLMDRVAKLQQEIEEETEEKMKEKGRKGFKNLFADDQESATVDWDESTADLVAEAEEMIHFLEKEARRKAREGGDLSDSTTTIDDSDDQEYGKKRRKKKVSMDTRKILAAARKQARECEKIRKEEEKRKKLPKSYSGFEEVPDEPEVDDVAVCEVFPVTKMRRDGVTDPVLIRAARQVKRDSEKKARLHKTDQVKKIPKEQDVIQSSTATEDDVKSDTATEEISSPTIEEADMKLETTVSRTKLLPRVRRAPFIPKKSTSKT